MAWGVENAERSSNGGTLSGDETEHALYGVAVVLRDTPQKLLICDSVALTDIQRGANTLVEIKKHLLTLRFRNFLIRACRFSSRMVNAAAIVAIMA